MSKTPSHHSDTKELLLETAEKLFIAHGYAGVSIRQLTEQTKTNVASVNYHFGDKNGLFSAFMAKRLSQITEEKLTLLKELSEQNPPPELEEILNKYIRSFFDSHYSCLDNDRFMQLIYHEMGPDAVTGDLVATSLIIPINQAFKQAIMQACPELEDKQASFCVSSITAQILHFIRSREILRKLRSPDQSQTFVEDVINHITQFSMRGLGSR